MGYDVAVSEDVVIPAHATVLAPTGLYLARPLDLDDVQGDLVSTALMLLPRSSLAKQGLLIPNSPGLVDADYGGELKVLLYNPNMCHMNASEAHGEIRLAAGTRVAQLVFVNVTLPELMARDVQDPVLVRGGFGSTGVSV
jgi:dUTP pyrophosphatase